MDIFVDDNQIKADLRGDATVEDALRYVQSTVCSREHIVVGLRCDGRQVAPGEMPGALASNAATLHRLDVFTGTRASLVADALTQALTALEETEAACHKIADLLTEGSIAEGISTLGECLAVWQQIHDAVGKSIAMLGVDPDAVEIDGVPLKELIVKPVDVLLQVKQALQSQDHVLLADVMQYEFQSVTQQWFDVINLLRNEAEKLDGAGEAT